MEDERDFSNSTNFTLGGGREKEREKIRRWKDRDERE